MMRTQIKTAKEIEAMRESGRMLATVLQSMKRKVAAGMTTKQLSDMADRELRALGGKPTIQGYQGFPEAMCVSVNNEVVHGIPRADHIIAEGDLVSLDFCNTYHGMITDSALSVIVGTLKQANHKRLLQQTEVALYAGIDAVHDRVRAGDIGASVEAALKQAKLGIVRDLVGHGVGHEMHEDPNIPNYGRAGSGPWLDAGMTIAIEPMATLGTDRVVLADDGWTILTQDGSWAAHFEHTVLITQDGAEILTQV
jgi:methionyl aminopeptidase